MPIFKQEQSKLWDEYKIHLIEAAQKVWLYAMNREKWQRYFKNLSELERSRTVICLRGQVSDPVYESLLRVTERFESQPHWIRWVLLAFTSVGSKVSLYHILILQWDCLHIT